MRIPGAGPRMAVERMLLYGFLGVLVFAPMPFGSVETWAGAALSAACLALGAIWAVWRSRRGLSVLPWRDPVLAAGALFALVAVVQMIPLPRPFLQAVSPKAVELRDRYEPPTDPARLDAVTPPAHYDGWRPISLYPWATRQAILRFVAFLVAALITIDLASLGHARRVIVAALVAGGAFQALYGLAEYFSGRQHIFGYAKKYYTDAATGTFINRNHFAGHLEMTLPFVIALAATAVAGLRGTPGAVIHARVARASSHRLFTAASLLILALTMATALVCSGSRMGIASTLLALLSVGLVLAWRGRGRSFLGAAIMVGGAMVLIFSQGEAASAIVNRFVVAAGELRSDVGRWQVWSQALGVAGAFPLMGAGLGTFPYVFPAFRSAGEGVALAHAHSDFIELAAEVGAAGYLAALAGVFLVARPILRRAGMLHDGSHLGYAAVTGLAALAVHSLADFNLAIPSNALTLAVLAGLALWSGRAPAVVVTPIRVSGTAAPRAPAPRWLPAGALAALAVLVIVAVPAGDASRLSGAAAREAMPAMSDLQALAQQATSEQKPPSREAARYVERRLLRAMGMQAHALRQLPVSSTGHLQMGRLHLARCAAVSLAGDTPGDCPARVMAELRKTLDLAPMSASAHADVARILMAAWPILDEAEGAQSKAVIERAIGLNPKDTELRQIWLARGGS